MSYPFTPSFCIYVEKTLTLESSSSNVPLSNYNFLLAFISILNALSIILIKNSLTKLSGTSNTRPARGFDAAPKTSYKIKKT
jgi:hypothetical protein